MSPETKLLRSDFRHPKSFPSYTRCCPQEGYGWSNFFHPTDDLKPRFHWCFLGEIIENVTEQLDLCALKVRDKDGKMVRVIFNFLGEDIKSFDWTSVQLGHSIAILYPEQRRQPTLGFREMLAAAASEEVGTFLLKEPSRVKIVQCDLEMLLNINDTVGRETINLPGMVRKCGNCQVEESNDTKLLRCSSCQSVPYCSQTCQKESWKKDHKRLCQAFKDVREIKTGRNWNKSAFSGALGFGEVSQEQKETAKDWDEQSNDEQEYGSNYRPYYGWDGVDVDADIEDILWGSYSEDEYEGYDSDEFGPADSDPDGTEDLGDDEPTSLPKVGDSLDTSRSEGAQVKH
ncbi:set domain protein [Moniliophthora roreri MCA 2997]|uniref:Set domain protein n=2 Tax=Moniliophthora roreri TaxID=221103 RepID=V2X6F3_MONRO|nr:set domain protein [Moniliophthora roreri MCA 2997]KAI3595138.1 set domain protein [Moniliophthora roreri]